jgi:hypothetical protein
MFDIHQKGNMFLTKVGFPMSTYLKEIYLRTTRWKNKYFSKEYVTENPKHLQ